MTRIRSITLASALCAALCIAGCSSGSESGGDGDGDVDAGGDGDGGLPLNQCTTGTMWTGGDSESPLMHPGGDCIGCHSSEGGPSFVVAGTVHAGLHDVLDCNGVPDAVVTVTDAGDQVFDLTTNEAGNFFLYSADATLAMPIHVKVAYEGNEVSMAQPPPTGACGSCHTAAGLNGAPGRILAP